MKNNYYINFSFALFTVSLLIGCSQQNSNNIDFDFTNLKKPQKIIAKKEIKNNIEQNLQIKDLVPLKNKEQVLSNKKFGKKDPFSEGDIETNQFNLDFKLRGFLNTEFEKYAIVKFLNKEGTLTEESIGELNTNLLPKDAKVIKIDPENKKLIISIDNKNFIFEL
tara:strand:- start:28 stop:522 length:495 start_codon:yes stop_codon:yes gene_type:complete